MFIKTNAIVLNRISYSETSLICRLFTQDQGKVTILAKGALRPKKTIGALLEPTNHIQIEYYYKSSRDIQILKQANFINDYSLIRNNYNSIIISLLIIEMIDRVTQDNNINSIIYRLGWRVLNQLNNQSNNKWSLLLFFMYQLSLRTGFMPNLTNCSICNSSLKHGTLNKVNGELICHNCHIGNQNEIINLSYLQQISSSHLDSLFNSNSSTLDILNSIILMENFFSFHIDNFYKIKSLVMVKYVLIKKIK